MSNTNNNTKICDHKTCDFIQCFFQKFPTLLPSEPNFDEPLSLDYDRTVTEEEREKAVNLEELEIPFQAFTTPSLNSSPQSTDSLSELDSMELSRGSSDNSSTPAETYHSTINHDLLTKLSTVENELDLVTAIFPDHQPKRLPSYIHCSRPEAFLSVPASRPGYRAFLILPSRLQSYNRKVQALIPEDPILSPKKRDEVCTPIQSNDTLMMYPLPSPVPSEATQAVTALAEIITDTVAAPTIKTYGRNYKPVVPRLKIVGPRGPYAKRPPLPPKIVRDERVRPYRKRNENKRQEN